VTGHGEKFGRQKELAIAALLAVPTLGEAAQVCGVSERTLRRWLQDEIFAQRYRRERTRMLESAVNLLRRKSMAAVETLTEVADDKQSPAGARVSAARSLIELAIKGAEVQDLEERITELEQVAREK
jgi:DNA-binding transcriptional MerR regulator